MHILLQLGNQETSEFSRIQWITKKDKNISICHRIAAARKFNNLIKNIYTPSGEWTTDMSLLKTILVNHFKHLYTMEANSGSNWEYNASCTLSPNRSLELEKPISSMEIDEAMKLLGHRRLLVQMDFR